MPTLEDFALLDVEDLQFKDSHQCKHVIYLIHTLESEGLIDATTCMRWTAVMRERHDIRSRSLEALESDIEDSETVFFLGSPSPDHRERAVQLAWFENLEDEVLEEKRLLDPAITGYSPVDAEHYRIEKFTSWATTLGPKLARRKEALVLVLKFKAEAHARRETRVKETMERLTDPAFPAELRLMVIEAAVESKPLHWKAPARGGLDSLARKFFVWPQGVQQNIRNTLQQTVADVLPKAFLVKMPLTYVPVCSGGSSILSIPQTLRANANTLHRLVVDQSVLLLRNGPRYLNLDRSIESMSTVKTTFPNLDICIFLLHIETSWMSDSPSDIAAKPPLVKFIAAFLDDGPGKRKLMRVSLSGVSGALVELGNRKFVDAEHRQLQHGESGVNLPSSVAIAERIFRQVYPF